MINNVTYVIDIVALLYLITLLHSSVTLNFYRKKPFLVAIILIIIIILSEAGTLFIENESLNLRGINIFMNVLGFALTPMVPIVITLIFDKRILTTHRLWLIPTIINFIATVLSPVFRYVFYIDGNNQYIRGEYFFIFIIVYIINLLFLVTSTLVMGKKYNYPIMRKMVALSLFVIVGTSIQLIDSSIYSSWHCVTLALFLYYIVISEFDSSFDTLTGLYNRAVFDKTVKEIKNPKTLSVIFVDINDFKSVNDTYGHDYGDIVLKAIAVIIRESFSKEYKCYRYGGDEFYIISTEVDSDKIESQLSTMINTLTKLREKGELLPTISYGYSLFTGEETFNIYTILKEADSKMYYYKKLHKAGVAT